MISFFLTVLEEAGRFRLWYICRDAEDQPNLAYAESPDGIHWEKPSLGIVEYHGSRENNLLGVPGVEGAVFRDPRAKTPEETYVYVTRLKKQGLYRYTSADGLHWRRDAEPLLPFTSDTQNLVFWDERIAAYVAYLRGWSRRPGSDSRWRDVVRTTAADLSRPWPVAPRDGTGWVYRPDAPPLISSELPVVLAADAEDPPEVDVYNLPAQPYPLDPRWYVAFPSWMRRGQSLSDGRLEVQFVGSRDGVHWERYDRRPYVAPGAAEAECECANMVFMGAGLVLQGEEIWQYGTGFRSRHGDKAARVLQSDGVVYRYVQRMDGFVSLTFGAQAGECVTALVTVDGPRLLLNVDTGGLGELCVALLDEEGRELPGYGLVECTPVRCNQVEAVAAWGPQQSVDALRGKQVAIRLKGERARLYSCRFG